MLGQPSTPMGTGQNLSVNLIVDGEDGGLTVGYVIC